MAFAAEAPWRPLLLLVVFAAGAHALHGRASAAVGDLSSLEEVPQFFLPNGNDLRPFTLGQATTISDLYWLREIQYVGTPVAEKAGWPQLLSLGELVTDLDPLHGYAYEVTGLLLAMVHRTDESNRIFDKGRVAVPKRWQLPFYEAFNEYYELRNYAKGGELLAQAAKLPGSPQYVTSLASKLYSAAGEVDVALGFVEGMLAQENLPDQARDDLETQRFGLQIERDLQFLESAVKEFERRTGHKPARLDELVGVVLERLPVAPATSEWIYDPATGDVESSIQDERVRYVHTNDLKPPPPPKQEQAAAPP